MIAKHINSHYSLKKQTMGSTFISLFYTFISVVDLYSIVSWQKNKALLGHTEQDNASSDLKNTVPLSFVSSSFSIQNILLSSQSSSRVVPWHICKGSRLQRKQLIREHKIFLQKLFYQIYIPSSVLGTLFCMVTM